MAVLSASTIFAPGREPPKSEIIQFLDMIQGTGLNPAVVKQTKAALDLVTPASETYGGLVLNDPDPTKNGYYYRAGAAWVKGRGFPDTFAVLTSIGGTANAITASTEAGVNPADVLCVLLPDPPGTNSPGTVTLALNGGPAVPVRAASGSNLAAGDIIEGVGTLFFRAGGEWRQLFSSATGATFDHQGDYAGGTTYTEGQVVTGSDGKWYQLKDPSATGDDPVGSVTGAWLEVLAAAGVADGAVSFAKLDTGLVVTTSETIAGNNNDITIPTSGAVALHVGTARDFTTVAAIKAIPDPTKMTRVGLLENGREGEFVWKSGDYAGRVASDPYNAFYIANDNIAPTSGAYVRVWGGQRPPVTWAGVLMDNTGDQSAKVQSLLDQHGSIFIPNGTMRLTSPLQHGDDCYIQFESTRAALNAAHSGAGIEGKNKLTERRFFVTIESGMIYGGGSLSYAVDMLSTTYGKLLDTRLYNSTVGWRNGGTGSQGAYYNEARGVTISSVTTGVSNGTLGNDIKMFGGSIKDMAVGTEDNDNSSVLYDGVAIETFTAYGSRVSHSGAESAHIRLMNNRYENPSTSGLYASAIAISIASAGQSCQVGGNYIAVVATGVADSGSGTNVYGN